MQAFKIPENNDKYTWTSHVIQKMKYYKLSPSRIMRIIRNPDRTEEGIVENTVVSMKDAGTKRKEEIWVMYKIEEEKEFGQDKLKIITAWRYPGKTEEGNPVPEDVIREIQTII